MPVVCPASDKFATPTGPKSQTQVPTELLGKTSSRLNWLAILVLVSTILLFLLRHFLQPELHQIEKLLVFRLVMGVLVLAPIAVIAIHRMGVFAPARVLEVGVAFEVLVTFALAVLEFLKPRAVGESPIGMSSLPMLILVFGIFVPNTPVRTLVASAISALMGPLAYVLLLSFLKIPAWSAPDLALWFVPSFLMAGWSYFLSRDIYQMEVDINRAREMGSYSLEKVLGRGGMGEVWQARHRRLCRGAAVKLIRPEVLVQKTGREAHIIRRRFEHEAQATARLQSPHTVGLYDFGVSDEGSFYYAMELLEGIEMESMIERFGPQPPARVVSILRQVCDSLAEAHACGLIHRDIKPSNVFLARLGLTYDFVKVLDFGLVKGENDGASRLTLEGTAAGTPAYMAPELATGAPFDARVDIYSLGCVAYFLLTGAPVFDEPSPVAVALAHVQKEPVPPSQRSELVLPASLEKVVLRCLAKNPEDRPQSATALARLLEECDGIGGWAQSDAEHWWRIHLPDSVSAHDAPCSEVLSTAN